ncbi:MAG: inositol monophosphatase family protein [Campylobacterota bacterium]|nr:inositol monophosphatase family protein [Campylobacterota bacterium]
MITTQLITIVKACRDLFLEGYHSDKNIQFKGTVDLVTEYDLAIEKYLTEHLSVAFPEFTIVGEEQTTQISHPSKAIYVDPIDGTTNFVHGIPFCAISVGMWEEGKPLAAIVYNPVLDECFTAQRGKGAFLNGTQINVSKQREFQQSLLATGFPYTKVEKGKDYEWVLQCMTTLLPITRDIRRLGAASIDLCYIACGKYDAFYECNLKPWDVAAGILILQEAGGKVSKQTGEAYHLDDHIIVASNGLVHDVLLKYL